MYEILIHDMDDGIDGNLTFLGKGLPASPTAIEEMMIGAKVPRPYIAHSYSFRLNELNSQITGPLPLDKLNSLATLLSGLSEYERIKLEGAALLTNCGSIEDCAKLLYNLDSFDLTPNVGDYESLGRYLAANDFANSLANCPADAMEHFDYDLLGRMGWDDSTNAFIKGHHIRDMENELRESNLNIDPLACYMKMRLCSDANPDGVWIKFPLSGMAAVDAPEQSDELHVALASLKAESLAECRAVESVSEYPGLSRCLDTHTDIPMEQLLWKAHNLGLGLDELSQYGKDAHAKFAAALEYEGCSNLDFAADISKNFRCYDFAPSIEAYAEKYLLAKGVDTMLASCFDLKKLGDTLAADSGAVITESGVISRNDHDFVFDYYRPAREKEIRLYCPLEVRTDPDSTLGQQYGDCPNEFEYATISSSVARHYEREINAQIKRDMDGHGEQERGLAPYLDSGSGLKDKVYSIKPSVEVWNNELWGVVSIKTTTDMNRHQMAELDDHVISQFSDGWGEHFEQHPIKTRDGDLYVSFWQSGDGYFMKPEQDFKGGCPEMGPPEQQIQNDSPVWEQTMGM